MNIFFLLVPYSVEGNKTTLRLHDIAVTIISCVGNNVGSISSSLKLFNYLPGKQVNSYLLLAKNQLT